MSDGTFSNGCGPKLQVRVSERIKGNSNFAAEPGSGIGTQELHVSGCIEVVWDSYHREMK